MPAHSGWELRKIHREKSLASALGTGKERKAHKFAYKQIKQIQRKIAIHTN